MNDSSFPNCDINVMVTIQVQVVVFDDTGVSSCALQIANPFFIRL